MIMLLMINAKCTSCGQEKENYNQLVLYFWRRDIQLCNSRIKQFWWHRVETLCHANLVVTFKSFLSHHNPLLNPSYGFEHRSNNESFTFPSFITDNKSWFHREHFWFQWISLRLWNVEKSWLCFNFFFFFTQVSLMQGQLRRWVVLH